MKRPHFLRTLVIICIFIGCVILLHIFGYLRIIERPIARILHLTSSEIYRLSIWNNGEYELRSMTHDELQTAFLDLQEKYRLKILDIVEIILLREENNNLKNQLNFFSEKKLEYITARITGKHVDPFKSVVQLYFKNAYEHDFIGRPAITEDGIFVGVVKKIEGDTIAIRLLGDIQTKIGGALLNDQKTIGIVEGGFGKSIRMNFIPQNEKVSVGDIVVSSGLTEEIPYGLPIGIIEAIEKEPYQPFQSAIIAPLANPNTLNILSIIIESENID